MKYELTHAQKRILYVDDLYPSSAISSIGGIYDLLFIQFMLNKKNYILINE